MKERIHFCCLVVERDDGDHLLDGGVDFTDLRQTSCLPSPTRTVRIGKAIIAVGALSWLLWSLT
jgi:hypothetical protein